MNVLRAVVFGGSISATSMLVRCAYGPFAKPARPAPLQPPDWIFGVVWPALYATTGAAWVMEGARVTDACLGTATALCCAWLVVYQLRQRTLAALVLLATVVAVATALGTAHHPVARGLLGPLLVWTSFASYLNVYEVSS